VHEDNHLVAIASWARRIRAELAPLLDRRLGEVHFRPSTRGVAMVGLLPDRPQRGLTAIRNLERFIADFDGQFTRHCVECTHGRPTPEKALQSFLIADAYRQAGRMHALESAAATADPLLRLDFVTDEIAVPTADGKVVCDILALHVTPDGDIPVVLELKSARDKARLIQQVETYAAFVDAHRSAYEDLYGALLGRPVAFARPCARWIVWPRASPGPDRHEADLRRRGIRVVTYEQRGAAFSFRVGDAPP
jgi:hypothetical protein